jgi:hypothetical protein
MKRIPVAVILISFLATSVSAATLTETSDAIAINGASQIEVELRGLKITGENEFAANVFAKDLKVEVDHEDYKQQPTGVGVEPDVYTTYPGNQSTSSELASTGDGYSMYIFPVEGSELPTLEGASTTFSGKSHSDAEFKQEPHQFQKRSQPAVDVDQTTKVNVLANEVTIKGDFLLVIWELSATLNEENKQLSTGHSVENRTYLPNGEIILQDKYYRIAYLKFTSATMTIDSAESNMMAYSESFTATSMEPPTFEDGRILAGVNGTQEYVLAGTQNGDRINFVIEAPYVDPEPAEPEPQVTVSKAIIPKWLVIVSATLPIPLLIGIAVIAMHSTVHSAESRARRGQLVHYASWMKYLPRKLRERRLRAQCISSYKNDDEAALLAMKRHVGKSSTETAAFHEFLLAKLCVRFGRYQDAKQHTMACLHKDPRYATEVALDVDLQSFMETRA